MGEKKILRLIIIIEETMQYHISSHTQKMSHSEKQGLEQSSQLPISLTLCQIADGREEEGDVSSTFSSPEYYTAD